MSTGKKEKNVKAQVDNELVLSIFTCANSPVTSEGQGGIMKKRRKEMGR